MRREDMPKSVDLQNDAIERAIKRGDPIHFLQVHRPLTVEISPEGSATVKFLFARQPDGTGLFAQMQMTPEATRELRAILLASERIPDVLPPTPDPKQAS